jgi:hypothetical protein
MEKKLNLIKLNEQLSCLHHELKKAGAPKTAIRRVEDIAVSVKWLEDQKRKHVK